jgi:hypothetical protein
MLSSCDVKLLPWVSIVVLVRLFPSVPPIDRVIGLLSSCLFDEFDSFWNLQGRQLFFFPFILETEAVGVQCLWQLASDGRLNGRVLDCEAAAILWNGRMHPVNVSISTFWLDFYNVKLLWNLAIWNV